MAQASVFHHPSDVQHLKFTVMNSYYILLARVEAEGWNHRRVSFLELLQCTSWRDQAEAAAVPTPLDCTVIPLQE